MLGLIFSLLVGALAGHIAGRIMGSETSAARNIVLGILGGFVGSILSVSGSAANCSSKRLNTTIKNTSAFVSKTEVFSFVNDCGVCYNYFCVLE